MADGRGDPRRHADLADWEKRGAARDWDSLQTGVITPLLELCFLPSLLFKNRKTGHAANARDRFSGEAMPVVEPGFARVVGKLES